MTRIRERNSIRSFAIWSKLKLRSFPPRRNGPPTISLRLNGNATHVRRCIRPTTLGAPLPFGSIRTRVGHSVWSRHRLDFPWVVAKRHRQGSEIIAPNVARRRPALTAKLIGECLVQAADRTKQHLKKSPRSVFPYESHRRTFTS